MWVERSLQDLLSQGAGGRMGGKIPPGDNTGGIQAQDSVETASGSVRCEDYPSPLVGAQLENEQQWALSKLGWDLNCPVLLSFFLCPFRDPAGSPSSQSPPPLPGRLRTVSS